MTKHIDKLFKDYLKVCNTAMEANKDKFPYEELMSVSKRLLGKHKIDLAIYDDEPKGTYSIAFEDDKLAPVEDGPKDPESAWRINLSYLKKVVANPERYIRHPEKLDLDWLKSRIGL